MVNLIGNCFLQLYRVALTFLEIVISLLLSVGIVPLVTLLALANEIIRLIVSVCLRIKFGSRIKLVQDGADNIWSFRKRGNRRTSLVLVFFKDPLDVETYRELFFKRVINYKTGTGLKPYERLTYIYTKHLGYFCWKKDENFNIKNHVRYYPGSENKVTTESEFLEKILPELSQDMKGSTPQWEEVIIPKLKYNVNDKEATKLAGELGTVTVRIFRYHHAILDGASNLMMWTTRMVDGNELPYTVDPLAPLKIPLWKTMMYNLSCILLGATSIIKSIHVSKTIKNRFVTNNFTGKRIFSWASPIEISQLNEIRAKTKFSVSTILAAAIGGALRKLDQKYPPSKDEFKNLPDELLLGLVAALLPYPDLHLRNRFTVVPYPINISGISRFQRLQLAGEEMEKLSRNPICYLNFVMFKVVGRFPDVIIQHLLRDTGLPIIFSNIPTMKKKVMLWGNELVDSTAWPPILFNNGLSILTTRYSDHMRICGVADEACLPQKQLNYLLTEVHNEVKLMFEECSKLKLHHQIIMEENLQPKKIIPEFHIKNN